MTGPRTISRRDLIKGAGTVTAAAAITGPFFPGRVLGANDRVNVACVGIRGQGAEHIKQFAGLPNVRVKTLCDVDGNLFASRLDAFTKKWQYTPTTASDMRRVFEDKEIDAVSLAIPNFWHALGAIWACQAGKNVYVEKPACHTLFEGRQMVHAARKHGVVVQVGFQNRSRLNTRAAIDFVQSGKLGKVYRARGLCFKPRTSIGSYPDGPMPDDAVPVPATKLIYSKSYLDKVDYDLWTGPAPQKPFNPNRFHYNWHWHWDYGNGDTGNQGPHQFDVGRWGLGKEEYPVRVRSFGGTYAWESSQETPNEQTTILEYADGVTLEFATRGLPTNAEGGIKIGNVFYGSEGRLEIDADGNWKTFLGPKDEPGPTSASIKEEKADATVLTGSGMTGHFVNFVEAVRAKNPEKLSCDIEVGFRSSVLPILANVSYRTKRELKFDGKTEQIVADAEANKLLQRKDRKGFVVPKLGPLGLRA